MLEVVSRWNRWGGAVLPSGTQRDITEKIYSLVNTSDVIVLIGMRRSGKTTILFQLMDHLELQGISKEAILHINFEEPLLASHLTVEALDALYNDYRAKIFPKGRAYLFFDEIQHVSHWERWVRARNESDHVKIFLTGSSAHMMSRELGTLLTGRHLSITVYPLSFSEFLRFKKIPIPAKTVLSAPHEINHALEQYLMWGGLPGVVLSHSNAHRELLLKQYFDDLLFKDIAMRHEIRDITLLRHLAVYLLTQTASLVSYHRIANQFGISIEKARSYCAFLQEAFLIDCLSYFSLKTAERNRHPFKVHAVDLGLRQVVALSGSADYGRLMETVVCHQLRMKHSGELYYWIHKQEIDFLRREKNTIVELIQVAQQVNEPATLRRELSALSDAKKHFTTAKETLITGNPSRKKINHEIALWKFLLV